MKNTFTTRNRAKSCPGHRVLALNRGEKEKILTVKVEAPEEKILQYLEAHVITGKDPGDVSGP